MVDPQIVNDALNVLQTLGSQLHMETL